MHNIILTTLTLPHLNHSSHQSGWTTIIEYKHYNGVLIEQVLHDACAGQTWNAPFGFVLFSSDSLIINYSIMLILNQRT